MLTKKFYVLLAALFVFSLSLINPHTTHASYLDTSFGTDGKVLIELGGDSIARGFAVQADGKILTAGSVNGDWVITRHTDDGTLDTSFGVSGKVIKDFGSNDMIWSLIVQPDGKIVVGGYAQPGSAVVWTLGRYNTDGSPDINFGVDGFVTTSFEGSNESVAARLVLQSDGKIVAAGYNDAGNAIVARYNSNGALDTAFGIDGIVATPGGTWTGIALQANDNKIVTAGTYNSGPWLARFNTDGSLDTSFAGIGFMTDTGGEGNHNIAVQQDGKIITIGTTGGISGGNTILFRYNSDGSRDVSFSGDGYEEFSLNGFMGSHVLLLPNDKIVLEGAMIVDNSRKFAFAGITGSGSLDQTFGDNGTIAVDMGTSSDQWIQFGSLDSQGRILGVGGVSNGSYYDIGITRIAHFYSVTTNFNSSADTYVRGGSDNRNHGGGAFMRLQSSGPNRSLVRFDQSALQTAIGDAEVLSAKLRVTIVDNANNWGTTGRTIDVHRLISDWVEGDGLETNYRGTGSGATWECAIDSNIANQSKNCSGTTEWEMGNGTKPWILTATDTETITNNQTGVVEFDVTADVQAFMNGTSNNGWVIKKTAEGSNGQVSFGTKESISVPQLVITYQP